MTTVAKSVYTPDMEGLEELSGLGNLVPVYREIEADLETPVSAYLKVARGDYSFLLESVEGGERMARYSFIGTEPYRKIVTGRGQQDGEANPLELVRQEMERWSVAGASGVPRFHGGGVGYISYEAMHHYEDVPSPEVDTLGLPEAIFMFADTLLVFDHIKHSIKVVSHVRMDEGDLASAYRRATEKIDKLVDRLRQPIEPALAPLRGGPTAGYPIEPNVTREQYERNVEVTKEYIKAGDIIQAVISQRFSRKTDVHPFNIYRSLRKVNPSPYMFYLDLGSFQLVGASPEVLVREEEGTAGLSPAGGHEASGEGRGRGQGQ